MTSLPLADDRVAIDRLAQARAALRAELAKVVVGQDDVVEQLLVALVARGHCLLEGVPGLAKTLLVSTLARALDLRFRRIQFTPDLMPADITGTEVLAEDQVTRERSFRFVPGPVFANLLLADEINRAPPKTQAALLEAMQERRVTVGGEDHLLPAPFLVLATQNPIEQEGTYGLPEAQLDRFFFKIVVGYPAADDELEIIRRVSGTAFAEGEAAVRAVLGAQDILALQQLVLRVPVADHVVRFIRRLVRSTRAGDPAAPAWVGEQIAWGAGPRAGICLALAAKARAVMAGNLAVAVEDVAAIAAPVLRHRLQIAYAAAADGVTPDAVVGRLLAAIPRDRTID